MKLSRPTGNMLSLQNVLPWVMSQLREAGENADSLCKKATPYIASYYACRQLVLCALGILVCSTLSYLIPDRRYIRTRVAETAADSHRLHSFANLAVTSERKSRTHKDSRGRKRTTYYTVYHVQGFDVTQNKQLRDLRTRPDANKPFPVKLKDGAVEGGTVQAQQTYWNPCRVTLQHAGTSYRNQLVRHGSQCQTLQGTHVGRYLDAKGTLSSTNFGGAAEAVLWTLGQAAKAQCALAVTKLGILFTNWDWVARYELPAEFSDGTLGEAGKSYATWWTRAFTGDRWEDCIQAMGDLAETAGDLVGVADGAQNVAALGMLGSDVVATHHMRNVVQRLRGEASHNPLRFVAWRVGLYAATVAVCSLLVWHHLTRTILRAEAGVRRPVWMYAVATIACAYASVQACAAVGTVDVWRTRRQLRAAASGTVSAEFYAAFPAWDVARIAI